MNDTEARALEHFSLSNHYHLESDKQPFKMDIVMELKKSYEAIASPYGLNNEKVLLCADREDAVMSVFANAFAQVECQDLRVAEVLVSPEVYQKLVVGDEALDQVLDITEEGQPLLWGAIVNLNINVSDNAVLCLPDLEYRSPEAKMGVAECPRNKTFFDLLESE